ncbi:unnamed protein product [Pseudo-nitzschia multistriata]|uniref:Uncharacterized protein n=1 Tax=Pseudo-nitzschia multistriata TaxID=183589 RepID=A0A448ZT36_9STRA|nr:unnamed protein product [Pseudo-nitzschia multistriata]
MARLSLSSVAVLFALAACSFRRANSFTGNTLLTTENTANNHALYAKKPAKKNKSKKKGTGNSGGGGFGKVQIESTTNKVRSVSGHAGSGEKPLRQAANTFDAIRKDHGKEATNDVYCYSPLDDEETFWYVGKVAARPGVSGKMAVLSQKRLILEYSKRELRPQNLGGKYASALELWLAPGDSEMDAVQNKVSLTKVEGTTKDLSSDFSVKDVGYNPEIYVGDEVEKGGLRIKRDPSTGKPTKPVFEVNESM